jgi:hypothetical protein
MLPLFVVEAAVLAVLSVEAAALPAALELELVPQAAHARSMLQDKTAAKILFNVFIFSSFRIYYSEIL